MLLPRRRGFDCRRACCNASNGALDARIAKLLGAEDTEGTDGVKGTWTGRFVSSATFETSSTVGFSSTVGVGTRVPSGTSPPGGGGSLDSSLKSTSDSGEAASSSLNSSAY